MLELETRAYLPTYLPTYLPRYITRQRTLSHLNIAFRPPKAMQKAGVGLLGQKAVECTEKGRYEVGLVGK
jgi:hypothetical protein